MPGFRKLRGWLRLPSRIGLLVGFGALSMAGARADVPVPPVSHSPGPGEPLLCAKGGRIYLSEGGREFHELDLGDTADAHLVREFLAGTDGTAIPLHPTILAGAGGAGFHWTAPPSGESTAKPADRRRGNAKPPAAGSSPEPPPSHKAGRERTGGNG